MGRYQRGGFAPSQATRDLRAARFRWQRDRPEAAAIEIANAYTSAIYLDNDGNEMYFGMSEAEFTKTLYSRSLVWAPDGNDEAFDDGSYVLQFDVGDRVRLIAFKSPESLVDPASVREVWLSSDSFYSTLREWRNTFLAEWESLPKHS